MPVRTDVSFVTHDYFDVVGVRVPLGREFTAEDDRRGAPPVAVLTHRYWRRTLNADPSVIGRTILVGGKSVTIVGVLERGFRGLDLTEKPDLYLGVPHDRRGRRSRHQLFRRDRDGDVTDSGDDDPWTAQEHGSGS